jgi:hypothetical protein
MEAKELIIQTKNQISLTIKLINSLEKDQYIDNENVTKKFEQSLKALTLLNNDLIKRN